MKKNCLTPANVRVDLFKIVLSPNSDRLGLKEKRAGRMNGLESQDFLKLKNI